MALDFPVGEEDSVAAVERNKEALAAAAFQALSGVFGPEGVEFVNASNGLQYIQISGEVVARRFGLSAAPALMVLPNAGWDEFGRLSSAVNLQVYPQSSLPDVRMTFDAHPGHNPSRFFGGMISAPSVEALPQACATFYNSLEAGLNSIKQGDFTDAARAPFSLIRD